MGLDYLYITIVQLLICEVITSHANSPYVQYAALPYPTSGYTYPASVYAQQYVSPSYQQAYAPTPAPAAPRVPPGPSYQPYLPAPTPPKTRPSDQPISTYKPTYTQPPTNPSTNPKTPQPIYQTYYQTPQPVAPPIPSPKVDPPVLPTEISTAKPVAKSGAPSCATPFDNNVLNNLAIALQLLIVSNLLHNPPPDLKDDAIPAISPLPIPYVPPSSEIYDSQNSYAIPSANFLASTGFGETGISKSMMSGYGSPTLPNPRPAGFMSPYDAIGPNSPYTDVTSRRETKSPYHLSSDYKDLFSLTELFKI